MIGERLVDRYEVSGELGRGGMGVVYRARDPRLNRDVAIKLIPPNQLNAESEQRFQREAQIVAQMDHPAIVPIYDFGRHDKALFFVMPLMQGTNLRDFLRLDSRLGDVVDIGIQVAEALEYSHARGVVHRDIKPDNIMVSREEGAGVRVRVMDFGLARGATESRLTKTGTLVGTLSYLSPEQVLGAEVDGRSDIYALGTVLYEAVVGERPFVGEPQSVVYRIVHEFPQAPSTQGANIDDDLEQVIMACLAKEPGKRLQRAGELAEALKRYRSGLHESDRTRMVTGFTRTFQAQRPALSPFIGRTKEFAELQQRLNAAVAGECQFAVIAGEPGIGKTRLVDELENLAKARQILVLHGRSVEQDRAFPFQGFCEVIQEYFRLKETGSAPHPDFSDLASDLVSLFPMLNEIRQIRSAATGESQLIRGASVGPENRTQIFELLARTLTRLANGKPLVLLLEDLHQADISIEALQYVVRRLGPTPTLIVGTYRSTEVDARHTLTKTLDSFRGDRRFASITLGPLSPSEHRSLLEVLVGANVSSSLIDRLYQGSEGNPFFTKELVRSLMDSGGIARDDSGAWNLSPEAGVSAEVMPATIQQAVEKRIERLPEQLRDILSLASVVGRSFDARDLSVLAEGRGDVEEAIDRLLQDGLIEEDRQSRGDVLTFSSGVVRDVLYAGLSRRKRRSVHRRYAELLEGRHSGRLERVLPQLVHHFSQGDVPEKTVEFGLRLARASLEAFSAEEATRAAKTTLEFLDEEWSGERGLEGEARVLLARALRMGGDIEGALREAAAAVRILEQSQKPGRAVGAMLLAADAAWQARRTDDATRWAEKGLAAARAADETDTLRQLLALAATLANLQGEYDKANAYLEEAGRLSAPASEAGLDSTAHRGGRLVVALANPVVATEPTGIRTIEEEEALSLVFETLVMSDARGHLVPALCASWEALGGGRTFLFRLREDVRFQDGHPLHAEDVKASIERSVRESSDELSAAYSAIRGVQEFINGSTDGIDGVVIKSDHELEIQLAQALPIYAALLCDGKNAVTRVVPATSGDAQRLVGTGPFLRTAHGSDRLVVERNPHYWRTDAPRLDAVEFRLSMSAAAIAKGFRSGEIDVARDLLPQDLEELLREPRFRQGLVETPKRNTYFVLFNTMSGPTVRHLDVRRALAGVVRTRDLVWRSLGRFAEPAVGIIPPGMLGHDPGRRLPALTKEEAQNLLRSAGIDTQVRLKATVHPLLLDRYGALLTTLRSVWEELGVTIELENSTMAAFLDGWKQNAELDLWIGRWNADYDDPDTFTHYLFHSATGQLRSYFSRTESDLLLDEARAENRASVREALYRKYETLLMESAALVPLFHDIDYRLASPDVEGLKLRASAPYVNYIDLGKAPSAESTVETRRAGGGVLQIPMVGAVNSLDPALMDTVEQGEVVPNMFETLTRDAGGARIVPWLAEEFRAEEGGRRYRFRLRDDVRFHDGRRMSARDVRYSFEGLLKRPDSDSRWFFMPIKGAKAMLEDRANDLPGFKIHSALEFTIELEEPLAFFPALIAHHSLSILPEGCDLLGATDANSYVGTGPFKLGSFEPGRRAELERNKTYWRSGYPRADGLVFTFGVSPGDILSGFRSGRFSLGSDLAPTDVESLRREPDFAPGYRETPRLITYFISFNNHRGPLADRALRLRLANAVQVPKVIRQTLGRLAVPATSLVPPGLLSHESRSVPYGDASSPAPAERAQGLVEVTANIHPIFMAAYSGVLREITTAFERQGVKLRPLGKTMNEFIDAERHGSAELQISRWAADYPDPDTFAHILHSREGNVGRICGTPELDRLIERGRAETIVSARQAIYKQIEELIASDAILLPLFHEQAYRFARPEVEGLSVSFGLPTVAYENLRIKG